MALKAVTIIPSSNISQYSAMWKDIAIIRMQALNRPMIGQSDVKRLRSRLSIALGVLSLEDKLMMCQVMKRRYPHTEYWVNNATQ